MRTGHAGQGAVDLSKALEIARAIEDSKLERRALRFWATVLEIQGKSESAEAAWRMLAEKMLAAPEAERRPLPRARLAKLDDESARTPEAMGELESVLDAAAADWDSSGEPFAALVELAWMRLAGGDAEGCRSILNLLSAAPSPRGINLVAAYRALQARMLAADGQIKEALELLDQLEREIDPADRYRHLFVQLSKAWVLRRGGGPGDASAADALLLKIEHEAKRSGFLVFVEQARRPRLAP